LFRVVLVVEARCMDCVGLQFSETKGENTLLIIDHLLMDSQLDFIDVLLAGLRLETQIEYSDEGTEMFVIAIFGKATLKDSRGNE
jgi:hypothetical protein